MFRSEAPPTLKVCPYHVNFVVRVDVGPAICRKVLNHVVVSGLTWSPDEQILYVSDALTNKIWAVDEPVSLSTTELRRRVAFDLTTTTFTGTVGGMTTDRRGNLWIAIRGGQKVRTFRCRCACRLPRRFTVRWQKCSPRRRKTATEAIFFAPSTSHGPRILPQLPSGGLSAKTSSSRQPACGPVPTKWATSPARSS